MGRWFVEVPIAGSITVEVEAEDADQAKEAAWEKIHANQGEPEDVGDVEWEYLDAITSGNVCHARVNRVCAWQPKE